MSDSRTITKFRPYFKSKMMNKMSWWIDVDHLPKLNGVEIESIIYDRTHKTYTFGPAFGGQWIHNVTAECVPPSIRAIMEKSGCHYISFSIGAHNYGSLMYYSTDKQMYQKSLDPDQINDDLFAQEILESLIDKPFILLS